MGNNYYVRPKINSLTVFQIFYPSVFIKFEVGDCLGGVDGAVVLCHTPLHGRQELSGHTHFSGDKEKVVDIPHEKLCMQLKNT